MTNATAASAAQGSNIASSDFLIRGSDVLASMPGFKLVGRDADLVNVANVLMRKDNNNLVLHGQSGVGLSAVLVGLQASKENLDTPFDIVGKRFYWLDVDALFASGDPGKINEGFQKAMTTLKSQPDTVLVVEDTKDFLDGIRNNGVNNIMNTLMREARTNSDLQVVFEARDGNVGELFKAHSDISEIFSFLEVREPSPADLSAIIDAAVPGLEEYHGVKIADETVKMVVELTTKYPGLTLNTAQPKRSTMILEGALTAYRHKMHTRASGLDALEETLDSVNSALAGKPSSALADKSQGELEALKLETEASIAETKETWSARQSEIRKVYADQRLGEQKIRELDVQIEAERQKMKEAAEKAEADAAAKPEAEQPASRGIFGRMNKAGFETSEIQALMDQRTQFVAAVTANKAKYKEMTADINAGLELKPEHVLAEFSRLSGVPMNKLQQDETVKLLNLEGTLKERVFGQDEPVMELAKAVRRGRAGLKKPNKPIGSFIFIGPSGVGKTELAKALAAALFGDESALQVYDMSEYMEKHAAAKLIGSPPGYEGYEAGGILTNNMRRKPYCVNVFDEVEKANKTVFDLFLQIVDEGRLTDNHGIPSSFGNSINILTSNVGAKYFLDESLTFDEAKEKAIADLWNPDPEIGGFRPEFLNRFTGIFCFNRLGQPQIELIAGKSIKELNNWIADKGLKVEIPEEDKKAMCQDKYNPKNGARGIMNYIEREITSDVADTVLKHPDTPGTVKVKYDREQKKAVTEFIPAGKEAAAPQGPANQNTAGVAATAASAAFKPGK